MALKNIIITHTYKKEVRPFLESLDKEKYDISTIIKEQSEIKHLRSTPWSHETYTKIQMKCLLQESDMDEFMNRLLKEQGKSVMLKNIKFYTNHKGVEDIIRWLSGPYNPKQIFGVKHCTNQIIGKDKKNNIYQELIKTERQFDKTVVPERIFTMKINLQPTDLRYHINSLYNEIKNAIYIPIQE